MEKEKKTRKKKVESEKVSEIFEVEKNGEEKVIETHATEKVEEKPASQEQIKKENKIFRNIVIVMIGFVLMFFVVYMIINSLKHFEVNGVNFEIVKEGRLTLYKTFIPVIYNGSAASYNFYLRNDPRTLKSRVNFSGELIIKENAVLNQTEDFNCNGDGMIAIANVLQLYDIIEVDVIKDGNASCDSAGRYMFLNIQRGNETRIEKFGPSCYNIYINNCEILEGTERFMLETFVEVKQAIDKANRE